MLRLLPYNESFIRIACDDDLAKELCDYFEFDVPNARFMQKKFGRKWSGKIRLFKLRDHSLYTGLIPRVREFAAARNYPVEDLASRPPLSLPDGLVSTWAVKTLPAEFTLRDYQLDAITHALTHRRAVIVSPTGSGKSLTLYGIISLLNPVRHKTLIIVPSLGLITQMVNDFKVYGYTKPIETIQSGHAKQTSTDITVSTWQSLYELPPEYFQQYGTVIVDEVHTAKSKSLSGIMEKCTATKYRIGLTGTIDNTECHRLVLEGLFGPIYRAATVKDLQAQGYLAPLHVHMFTLDYPDIWRKQLVRCEYPREIDALAACDVRSEFIVRLVEQSSGNALVLFQLVHKQGKYLFQRLKELCARTGRHVHYITGTVSAEERERIRQTVTAGGRHIIVGSYGTMQLGINIPNLHTLIFAHPSKSAIRVPQSIGRALRPAPGKDTAVLYDLADDLRRGAWVNHTFNHAQARLDLYAAEGFAVKLVPVRVEDFAQVARIPLLAPNQKAYADAGIFG